MGEVDLPLLDDLLGTEEESFESDSDDGWEPEDAPVEKQARTETTDMDVDDDAEGATREAARNEYVGHGEKFLNEIKASEVVDLNQSYLAVLAQLPDLSIAEKMKRVGWFFGKDDWSGLHVETADTDLTALSLCLLGGRIAAKVRDGFYARLDENAALHKLSDVEKHQMFEKFLGVHRHGTTYQSEARNTFNFLGHERLPPDPRGDTRPQALSRILYELAGEGDPDARALLRLIENEISKEVDQGLMLVEVQLQFGLAGELSLTTVHADRKSMKKRKSITFLRNKGAQKPVTFYVTPSAEIKFKCLILRDFVSFVVTVPSCVKKLVNFGTGGPGYQNRSEHPQRYIQGRRNWDRALQRQAHLRW